MVRLVLSIVRTMRYTIDNIFSERLHKAVSISNKQPFYLRYLLALLSSALVILLKLGLDPMIGKGTPFLLILPAVLLTSWFGGVGAGIISSLITALGVWYYFLPPYNSLASENIMIAFAALGLYLIEAGLIIAIVYRRKKAYEEMQARTAQQAVVAAIGQYGLEESDLKVFMNKVVKAIAKTLDVEYCKILELMPDEKHLRIISGVGWKRGVVGKTLVDAGTTSHAGYSLQSKRPIIVTDLRHEKRFKGMKVLHDHGIISGISVVIPGNPQPFGILTVHTQKKRIFTKNDVNFIQSLANVLASSIERRTSKNEIELMAKLNSTLVDTLDPQETLSGVVSTIVPQFADICEVYINRADKSTELIELKGITKEKERIMREIAENYPPESNPKRPSARVLRSGKAMILSRVDSSYAEEVGVDEKYIKLLSRLRLHSLIVTPIKIRRKTIGVIIFGTVDNGHTFTQRDFHLAKEIADRVAVAIDNAILYQEVRMAVQARDEFLSIASHELKTPLTSMLLQLQSVLHSIKSDSLASFSIERTMKMLESTISQSKRLSKLVNDLLNISLITTGKLELEKERTDLVKLVKEVSERLEEQVSKSGSSIALQVDKKSVVGKWDRIRIEQVITNLITNAIKYGDGKGIEITVGNSNNKATLQVKDHGMGIPKDQQEKIFDRFQRGALTGSIKGLGVGLYLVNEIVKAHGGKIEVKSAPKQGSTFTVQLPL